MFVSDFRAITRGLCDVWLLRSSFVKTYDNDYHLLNLFVAVAIVTTMQHGMCTDTEQGTASKTRHKCPEWKHLHDLGVSENSGPE